MNWHRRRFQVLATKTAFVEEQLAILGLDAYASERQPGEQAVEFSLYADDPARLPSCATLAVWIEAAGDDLPDIPICCSDDELTEENWSAGFRAHFSRRSITDRVEVLPSWEERPSECMQGRVAPGPGAPLQIVLEPGQAFGTGDHPTTRACLDGLNRFFTERGPGARCLDVGSGTGILGIAALLWGASEIEGYDIDGASIHNAYLNADLNGLAGRLRYRWGEPTVEEIGKADRDLLFCNLFLGPILRLIPRFDAALAPGGRVILSGFLPEQSESIRQAAIAQGWRLGPEGERTLDGWVMQAWDKP